MGILGRLVGRNDDGDEQPGPQEGPAPGPSARDIEHSLIWIGGTLYEVTRSPNARWTLGWSDATPDGHRMGARGGGKGAWILLEEGQERARGRLERPNDGAVANDGRFVLPDWLFTDQLAGQFYAFAPDGTVLISERLGANAGTAAISPDGRTALVETLANPGDRTWSNLLLCYDLDARTRRWAINPPAGIVRIDFEDPQQAVLYLRSDRIRPLSLVDGSLGAAAEEPGTDNIWTAYAELEDEVRAGIETADAEQLAAWLSRTDALEPRFADYPNQQAKVLRMRGEVCEQSGRTTDAVVAYMAGLALDPGLGVKRRLKALRAEPPSTPRREPAGPAVVDDRPYASTSCPSCGIELDPLPKAKTKCRACGSPMSVRGGPDGQRYILREDQLEAHQALWQEAYQAEEREKALAFERQREADRAAGLIAGMYEVDVVGESQYQDALRRHAGRTRGTHAGEARASWVVQGAGDHPRWLSWSALVRDLHRRNPRPLRVRRPLDRAWLLGEHGDRAGRSAVLCRRRFAYGAPGRT